MPKQWVATQEQKQNYYLETCLGPQKDPLPRLFASCRPLWRLPRLRHLPLGPPQASKRRAPSRAASAAAALLAALWSAAGGTRCEGSAVARGAYRSQSINRRHVLSFFQTWTYLNFLFFWAHPENIWKQTSSGHETNSSKATHEVQWCTMMYGVAGR